MANQLPELHISLKYGLTNHMQSKYRGVILVPTNQYLQTKFLKKCKKCTCHETVVFFPFSWLVVVQFCLVGFFQWWLVCLFAFFNLHCFVVSDRFRFIGFCKIPSLQIRSQHTAITLLQPDNMMAMLPLILFNFTGNLYFIVCIRNFMFCYF